MTTMTAPTSALGHIALTLTAPDGNVTVDVPRDVADQVAAALTTCCDYLTVAPARYALGVTWADNDAMVTITTATLTSTTVTLTATAAASCAQSLRAHPATHTL